MSADRRRSGLAALAAFAALAGFSAFHWGNLVQDPPIARVVGVVAIAIAMAVALERLAGWTSGRVRIALAATLVVALGVVAGALVAGIPARLLAPGHWDELGTRISQGVTGLGGATYPYRADGQWQRLALIAALPLTLGAAAALTFWPLGRRRVLRALGLAVLVGIYCFAAVLYAPGHTAVHGCLLLALVAAWLWGPHLRGRRGAVATGLVAGAGLLALPLSAAMARDDPVVDYRSWSWTGGEPTVSFEWNHSYDLLDWPREGTTMLEVESEVPHYWRSVVLERFDGVRWIRSEAAGTSLELPNKVEGAYSIEHPEWLESTRVTIRELRSGLVVGPGSVQSVEGLTGAIAPDGTVLAGEVPESGQTYEVTSYAPDPTAGEMRAADAPYPESLRRFTTLEVPTDTAAFDRLDLPQLDEPSVVSGATVPVEMPLRGQPRGRANRIIDASGYGGVRALTQSLTADAGTSYDAVLAIERHFEQDFTYSELASEGARPLRAFLLRSRTGYCQQYSGAMALMLRMAGIPARVISGFSPGTRDVNQEGVFTVRDTDAHSWVEVYFVGIGWVPFDPTPSASPADLQSLPQAAAATPGRSSDTPEGGAREPDAAGGSLERFGDSGGGFPAIVLLALLALSALTAAAVTAWRRARFDAAGRSTRLRAQVGELSGALQGTRYKAGAGATLLELERRLRDGRRTATAEYVATLRSCLYGRKPAVPPDLHERRAARRELSRARTVRERLRLLAAMPPGGPRIPAAPRG